MMGRDLMESHMQSQDTRSTAKESIDEGSLNASSCKTRSEAVDSISAESAQPHDKLGVAVWDNGHNNGIDEIVKKNPMKSHSQSESSEKFKADTAEKKPEENVEVANLNEDVIDISPNGYSVEDLAQEDSDKLSKVRKVYIFDNKFTVLPVCLDRFKNMRSLKVFSNEVKLFPDELGDLMQLEYLQMKFSSSGVRSLPPLGKLTSLKILELQQAPMRPSISSLPMDISQLSSLTRLAMCNFSISFVPPEIGTLKNLEELDLSFNRLKNLPIELCSLTALKDLRAGNNRLVDLPSELSKLSNLTSIDVSHNKLTSLESLGLSAMTSLRALDAKFNIIQTTGHIPDWITCNLEGNASWSVNQSSLSSPSSSSASSDEEVLELESVLPSVGDDFCQEDSGGVSSLPRKHTPLIKNRRGWRRYDNQQQKARQDRLNISRKSRVDSLQQIKDSEVNLKVRENTGAKERRFQEQCLKPSSRDEIKTDCREECSAGTAVDAKTSELCPSDEGNEGSKDHLGLGGVCINDAHKVMIPKCSSVSSDLVENPCMPCISPSKTANSGTCRKVLSGDRSAPSRKGTLPSAQTSSNVAEISDMESLAFNFEEENDPAPKQSRRKHGSSDKASKSRKRRKSASSSIEASFSYYKHFACGFSDRLEDGFYDAGRKRPFLPLEVLENEEPSLETREVILVDRERDENLDAMVVSAQQLLYVLELAGQATQHGEASKLTDLQKATVLSLFVSDCFGGSDKELRVLNARRAALGGSRVPFVCSCSVASGKYALDSVNDDPGKSQGAVPSISVICDGSVRQIKMLSRSNVIPIGLIPYGVCRHRAILFKYLCDRIGIQCELIRGYLDYESHAWNIILVDRETRSVRMLVDACRPLDIREETDPEYFCRYIPLRRIYVPKPASTEVNCEVPRYSLHEEIDHGASGCVVRRCTLGSFTLAAKVRVLNMEAGCEEINVENTTGKFLSELRIFCSLGEHPCLVSFYGHEFSRVAVRNGGGEYETVQLVLFMEYLQGGSLEKMIHKWKEDRTTHAPAKLAMRIARDVIHAVSYLHSKGIIHRDIKSSNVLIDFRREKGEEIAGVKLCDFDSAVPVLSSSMHTCYLAHRGVPSVEACVGTPRWMAPEVLRAYYGRHSYGPEADIWSFGCLLLELLTLEVPYAGLPDSEVESLIQGAQRPKLPDNLDRLVSKASKECDCSTTKAETLAEDDRKILQAMVNLFESCTQPCPSTRPTALEVYEVLQEIWASSKTDEVGVPQNGISAEESKEEDKERDMEATIAETKSQLDDENSEEGKSSD